MLDHVSQVLCIKRDVSGSKARFLVDRRLSSSVVEGIRMVYTSDILRSSSYSFMP